MTIRVFLVIALLIFSSSHLQVARCEPDPDNEVVESDAEGGDLGIVGEDVQDFGSGSFNPAPEVETVCVFPKNPSKAVVAGEESELLVGIRNDGESTISIIAIQASVHLPYEHRYLLQNLSAQAFNNASVPPSAQATFPYIFGVSKFLQSGEYDLVGTIVYEIGQQPYQSTFYNGTIEVTEAGGMFSVESVFLFCLGIALLGLLGFWIRDQIQNLSKKTKKAPKVEVGTGTTDASMDEWLEVCVTALTFFKFVAKSLFSLKKEQEGGGGHWGGPFYFTWLMKTLLHRVLEHFLICIHMSRELHTLNLTPINQRRRSRRALPTLGGIYQRSFAAVLWRDGLKCTRKVLRKWLLEFVNSLL